MSQFDLCRDNTLPLPEIPRLGQSMLLIQTQKYCILNSSGSLDQPIYPKLPEEPLDLELSLELKMEKSSPQAINTSSTIKKRKGGCTCKKTKCLKMYCECFSSGKLCGSDCSCQGCSNDEHHSETIARAQELVKVKSGPLGFVAGKGCNCKKSQCQKKYCECYNAKMPCGVDCRCLNCSNSDGAYFKLGEVQKQELIEKGPSFIE